MTRATLVNYGLVFLGAFLVVGGVAVGFGALRYEFVLVSATEEPSDWSRPVYDYEDLPASEQRTVDGAIDGNRYVFDRSRPVPGAEKSTLRPQEILIRRGDTYYVFAHRLVFVATEPAGLASIAAVLAGLAAVGEAIRRENFPHKRYPWQGS